MYLVLRLWFSPRAHPSFCLLPFPPLPPAARAAGCHIRGVHLFVAARRIGRRTRVSRSVTCARKRNSRKVTIANRDRLLNTYMCTR